MNKIGFERAALILTVILGMSCFILLYHLNTDFGYLTEVVGTAQARPVVEGQARLGEGTTGPVFVALDGPGLAVP